MELLKRKSRSFTETGVIIKLMVASIGLLVIGTIILRFIEK
ncbi:MAG: hypothetical protein ACRC7N_20700 [Clostridium sp.]